MNSNNKEKRGIYNTTFNDKNSTPINTDLEAIENAVIAYVVHYVKGYHNINRDIGLGANHIIMHLEEGSQGQIKKLEVLDLGQSIREYLSTFKKPFVDEKGAKIFEWENNQGVRFRVIADKITEGYLKKITETYQRGGSQPPLSPSDEIIITFYSDRNLNQRMIFKNPEVEKYYEKVENKEVVTKAINSQNEKKLSDAEAEKKAKQKAAAEKVKEKQKEKTRETKKDKGFDR